MTGLKEEGFAFALLLPAVVVLKLLAPPYRYNCALVRSIRSLSQPDPKQICKRVPTDREQQQKNERKRRKKSNPNCRQHDKSIKQLEYANGSRSRNGAVPPRPPLAKPDRSLCDLHAQMGRSHRCCDASGPWAWVGSGVRK